MSGDMTAQPPQPSHPQPCEASRPGRATLSTEYSPAFTLIEMLIVVGIIAVLMAIAVPATISVVGSMKVRNTQRSLEVVQSAIDRYQDQFRALPPDYFVWYAPPRLPERWTDAMDSNSNGECDVSELPAGTNQTNTSDEGYNSCDLTVLTDEFQQISDQDGLRRRPVSQPNLPAAAWPVSDNATDPTLVNGTNNQCHRPIESLYFFITQRSPDGKAILEHLPEKALGNTDICDGQPCPDGVIFGKKATGYADDLPPNGRGQLVELKEILDAWGHPLHYGTYSIRSAAFSGNTKDLRGDRSGWRLTSDGPDGIAGNGDDITVSGTTK